MPHCARGDNRHMTSSTSHQPTHNRRLVGWLSLAQLITWGSVFYTFALLMEPVERELGLTRSCLAASQGEHACDDPSQIADGRPIGC